MTDDMTDKEMDQALEMAKDILAGAEHGDPISFRVCRVSELALHLAAELSKMEVLFGMRWKADMRAIKRWQEANPGNDLVWPDHADLVVWLMEQLQATKRRTEGRADMTGLKPCPFCGGPAAYVDAKHTWVMCECGASGSTGKDREDAERLWERRAMSAQPASKEPLNADHFVHLFHPQHDKTKRDMIELIRARDDQWRASRARRTGEPI